MHRTEEISAPQHCLSQNQYYGTNPNAMVFLGAERAVMTGPRNGMLTCIVLGLINPHLGVMCA